MNDKSTDDHNIAGTDLNDGVIFSSLCLLTSVIPLSRENEENI